jgi:hypothetical protein
MTFVVELCTTLLNALELSETVRLLSTPVPLPGGNVVGAAELVAGALVVAEGVGLEFPFPLPLSLPFPLVVSPFAGP